MSTAPVRVHLLLSLCRARLQTHRANTGYEMAKFALLILFISFPAVSETRIYPSLPPLVPDEIVRCLYINYDHRHQVFHIENGKEIPLEMWFEEHPEEAEKYYRRNAEMRKRAMKNIAAGLCPK